MFHVHERGTGRDLGVWNSFRCLIFYTFLKLQVDQLREAIEELYYFEFVLDDIPIWGFVGYMEESGFLPHSHKVFIYVSVSLTKLFRTLWHNINMSISLR